MSLILSGTDGLSDVDGSAATPAIRGTDANTGIFFPAADTIAFSEGGVESMRIDSAGNVGVGTTTLTNKFNVAGAIQSSSTLAAIGVNTVALSQESAYSRLAAFGPNTSTGGTLYLYSISSNGSVQNGAVIDSSGNLLVGTTSGFTNEKVSFVSATTSLLTLRYTGSTAGRYTRMASDGSANFFILDNNATGQYQAYGSSAWTAQSDERIKDIIEPITNAIEKVNSLRSVIGKLKKDPDGTRKVFLIAQDVQAVLPEAVNVQDDEIGTLGLQYTDVIPLLVAAIKEQNQLIQSLTDRITALETPAVTPPTGTQA